MSASRQAPFSGRRALLAFGGVAVAIALIVIFSGTLTRSTDVGAQADLARQEIETLRAVQEAGDAELAFVETEAFIQQEARSYGFGQPEEILFSLEDAPSPAPIVPIGPRDDGPAAKAPFEAWMELLFEA